MYRLPNRDMCKLYFFIYPATTLLLLILQDGHGACSNVTMDVSPEASIYYDLRANSTFPIESVAASRLPPFRPANLSSRGPPCSCGDLKCGCCAGLNITAIKLQRRACVNFTIVPEEFALDFGIMMDEEQVFTNRVSARHPPPACVPLYFFPAVTFCVRFFDLHVAGEKFNACIDFETRIVQWPLYILHFNCVKFGGGGVTWIRPEVDGGTVVVANVTSPEDYDEVNFEVADENSYTHTSSLTPEEEDAIGDIIQSESQAAYYPPSLMPDFMGAHPPTHYNNSSYDSSARHVSYFQNYRNETLSRFSMPPYEWGVQSTPYSPRPDLVAANKVRDRDRSASLPVNSITTIDAERANEIDTFYQVAQLHREQYKDHTGLRHPLKYFRPNEKSFQSSPSLLTAYLFKYPETYTAYKVPTVLPLTYERATKSPYLPELAIPGIYSRGNCIAYKR